MIKSIEYNENGSIDIDNGELLAGRADINNEVKAQNLLNNELGGIPGKEEEKEKADLKSTGWKEAKKATDVKHKCLVCGTIYWARPNKSYCSKGCKEVAKKRRSRKKKRDIRDFKPYRGKTGEVYFMYNSKDEPKTTFIPAYYADTRERAREYIEKICTKEKERDDYIKQVNKVIKK